MTLPPTLTTLEPKFSVPPLSLGIELKNVSFRYSEKHPWVLENVNLFFPKGKCLAVVGLNGAGKTTLVKLLARLYDPVEGQILWDGIDVRHFDIQEYRQCISAIFQDFARYDLTVRENIGLGNVSKIDDIELIEEAAKRVKIHDFIQNLDQNYQTILSRWLTEKATGTDLSGGQWQKIANARMFMRKAEFLILDEPTAALDAKSEYEIFSDFYSLVRSHTSLIISHRFSTVRIADYIAVLENGKITGYGTHQELIVNNKTYGELYDLQSSHYK